MRTTRNFEKKGASFLHYVCRSITSPQDRAARAKEAIASVDAAIEKEGDPEVLKYMRASANFAWRRRDA